MRDIEGCGVEMKRVLNRRALFTVLSFLAAPAVPALAALVTNSPIKTAIQTAALTYVVATVIAAPVTLPAFLVLRRRNLITWWSATFIGAIPSSIVLLAIGVSEPTGYFAFGAVGGLSGFVFWLVWRMGHRDHQTTLTEARAEQAPSRVDAKCSSANLYALSTLALFFAAWGWFYWQLQQKMNFDAVDWRSNAHDIGYYMNTTPRQRMADGFMRKNTLHGKTREDVDALLGPDSDSGYFRDYDLVYWLGPERGFVGIDSEWLVIKFSPDGHVADVRIVTD